MVTSSAPGKVYLFGEHAVVYGEPAVPCAIDRRVTVSVEQRCDSLIRITSPAVTFTGGTIEYGDSHFDTDIDAEEGRRAFRYVERAIEEAFSLTGELGVGLEVTIESELPIGAGLGSSAAVTVATLDAVTRELGQPFLPEELASHAYQVEYDVQNGRASRADTYCSTVGGAVRVEGSECQEIPSTDLPFVIGYDGRSGDTGSLVEHVRRLRENYGFVKQLISAIGDLVRHGETALATEDLDELGELMNINHGLLVALGVSVRSLDSMAWVARDAGAVGAKLTGAGGGGCVVALDPAHTVDRPLEHLVECNDVFRAKLASTGVRQE